MKQGLPKLTGRVYDIADGLAALVRTGEIGGWWLQASKGSRWLIQTDPGGAWPTDTDPRPAGCIALTDTAVRERYSIGETPKPRKAPKRTRKRDPLVYNGDDPAQREAARANLEPVREPTPAPEPSSPVGTPQEVTDWLQRLVHLPKRAYAAAYCDAVLNGAPMPDDPGAAWADKARRRADRVLASVG